MMFKKFFWATLAGTIISGSVGIFIAYKGGGVYALVAQHLINLAIDTIILAIIVRKPWNFVISFSRLKKLIGYGWKVMLSSALTTVVNSVRNTTIASRYNASDLAHYEKGESLPKIIIGNIDVAIASVLFPTMSNSQDDLVALKNIVRRFVKLSGYIIFPMLFGLFAVSDSLIPVLFGEQWIPAIPYLKIFALVYLFYPLQDAALLSIRAIGKSGAALIIDIIGKSVILISLFALLNLGPLYLTIGFLISTVVVVIINGFAIKKYINYGLFEQLFDFGINLIPSGIMLASVYFLHYLPINQVLVLIIQIVVGIIVYILISALIKNKQFLYLKNTVASFLVRINETMKNSQHFSWSSISVARPILMSLAIVWIIIFHAGIPAPSNTILRILWYIFIDFGGGFGVNIFLILSGLGLMYSHSKTKCYGSFKQVARFYWRRFSRIFISYTIIFVVYYIIKSTQVGGSFVDFIAKFTIYDFFATGFREFWYIHAIALLYLLFPLIAYLYDKVNHNVSLLIILVAFIGIEFLVFYTSKSIYNNIEIFLTRTPCFAVGCYFGYLSVNKKQINLPIYLATFALFIISFVSIFLVIHYHVGDSRTMRYMFFVSSSLLVIFAAPLISMISKKLRPLKWYGQFTLQLYLVHILMYMIFKEQIKWEANPLLMFAVVLIISSIVSFGLYYLEKAIFRVKSTYK